MVMLDRASWMSYIKSSLGFPVVNIYMTDEMIQQQINFAIMKVIPYVNAVEFIEVPTRVTKFTDRIVYAVLRVHSPDSAYTEEESASNTYYDLLISRSIYNQLGGTDLSKYTGSSGLVTASLYNYFSEEARAVMEPIGFRLIGDTLMIDGDNPPYTVEAVTDRSLQNITEDYQSWLLRYSLALCKQNEARILRKVKITGSPIEQDGTELMNEGITEQKELEEKLGAQMSLYFCTR